MCSSELHLLAAAFCTAMSIVGMSSAFSETDTSCCVFVVANSAADTLKPEQAVSTEKNNHPLCKCVGGSDCD